MRKLLIESMIVFLLIFTAGLASADESAKLTFPFTTITGGTLYFISDLGVVTSESTTPTTPPTPTPPTITIYQATVTKGEPTNLFHGTLKMNPTGTALLTINFSAIQEDANLFHITGTDGAGTFVVATGRILETCVKTAPHKEVLSIQLTGSIREGTTTTTTYRFEGTLVQ
jgi:hypothetical protein